MEQTLNFDENRYAKRFKRLPATFGGYLLDGHMALSMACPGVKALAARLTPAPFYVYAEKRHRARYHQWKRRPYSPVVKMEASGNHPLPNMKLYGGSSWVLVDAAKLALMVDATGCDSIGLFVRKGGRVSVEDPIAALLDGKPVGFLMGVAR
jgi:hypothetical protein